MARSFAVHTFGACDRTVNVFSRTSERVQSSVNMHLPSAALALCLLVEASALSGLQNFTEGTNEKGFISGKDRQYILTGTSFEMDGCIHQVKVSAEVHGGVFAIDVWRPDSQSSFTLASSVEVTPGVDTRSIFLLDASPPVQFQTGDLVGFHLVGNTGNFQVAWTSAPISLRMSSIITQGGEPPVTTFPGSWTDMPTTWPIMFLSTSSADFCIGAATAANSPTTPNAPEPSVVTASSSLPDENDSSTTLTNIPSSSPSKASSVMAVSFSLSTDIVPDSSTTSTTSSRESASEPADTSQGFPGDSPIPPGDSPLPAGGIAGILVAVLVVILLVTFSFLIVVCRLKIRKARWGTWKIHHTDSVNYLAMNSLAASTSPLIKGEEPRCVAVVMQPNPAYSTTFADVTTPSVHPCTPATSAHSSPLVMQPNPAYSTAQCSSSTASAKPTNLTAPLNTSSPAVPNPLQGSHSQVASNSYTSTQTKHHQLPADEDDHTYCSVSTADVNVYDYIDR